MVFIIRDGLILNSRKWINIKKSLYPKMEKGIKHFKGVCNY